MLLWHVVQTCVVNHRLLGAEFPCLEVKIANDSDAGFAVLKVPFKSTHIVVAPTIPVQGIESPELQAVDAPNYVKDAWEARHYVAERAGRPLAWDDVGLAINSGLGRSQDQLHIHVDCVQPYVRTILREFAKLSNSDNWVRLKTPMRGTRYWALSLDSPDLSKVNIFKLAMAGLHIQPDNQANLSLALLGTSKSDSQRGFYLLADLSTLKPLHGAHAEYLLDHSCANRLQ